MGFVWCKKHGVFLFFCFTCRCFSCFLVFFLICLSLFAAVFLMKGALYFIEERVDGDYGGTEYKVS